MISVEEVSTKRDINRFIRFCFTLYQDDPHWVAPLISEQRAFLLGKNNGLFANGPHRLFVAKRDGIIRARVLTGSDNAFIARKKHRQGYFCLFDCYEDPEAVTALMQAVAQYQRGLGNTSVSGPNSPAFNDFGMGALVQGFDGPPVLFNPYNKPYYESLLIHCGFRQYMDHYAYSFDVDAYPLDKLNKVSDFAMRKFGFRVVNLDLANPRVPADIHRVITEAVLSTHHQYDMPLPTLAEVQSEISNLRQFYSRDFAYIAYAGARPVGLLLAMPDYYQVLRHMRGRLFPWGLLKFLYYRKRIDGIRIIMQMVSPDYQNRAVTGAMYARLGGAVKKYGITKVEGSTIEATNLPSIHTAQRAGGELYRIYRQYRLAL